MRDGVGLVLVLSGSAEGGGEGRGGGEVGRGARGVGIIIGGGGGWIEGGVLAVLGIRLVAEVA